MPSHGLGAIFTAAWLGVLLASAPLAQAQDASPAQDAPAIRTAPQNNRTEFKSRLSDLRKSLAELDEKITRYGGEVGSITDPNAAKQRIESLQRDIAKQLAAVADNGAVAQLAERIIEYEHRNLTEVEASGFPAADKALLVKRWREIIGATERQIADLTAVRKDLAAMLKTVQLKVDYMDALERVDEGQRLLEIVKDLLASMKTTSQSLRGLLSAVPGS